MPVGRLASDPTFQTSWLLRLGVSVAPILFRPIVTHILTTGSRTWPRRSTPRPRNKAPGHVGVGHRDRGRNGRASRVALRRVPRRSRAVGQHRQPGPHRRFGDIALRDFGRLLAGLTMARLATVFLADRRLTGRSATARERSPAMTTAFDLPVGGHLGWCHQRHVAGRTGQPRFLATLAAL